MDLAEPMALLPGLVIQGVGKAARFDDAGLFLWMIRLRHEKEMAFADRPSRTRCSGRSWPSPTGPAPDLIESEGLKLREVDAAPRPA